jgi:drug/metabolite transporter (DMT)-like permease
LKGRALLGYALMVVTALSWAGAWITARLAAHDAPPLTVTVGRYAVASALLLPAWWWFDRGKPVRLGHGDWLALCGMSVSGIIVYTVLFLIGVSLAPASDGAVITPGLAGPFSILVAWATLRERPSRRVAAGALVSLAGVALVGSSSLRHSAAADSTRLTGDAIFATSALTWAIYTVLGRRLAAKVPAVTGILLCSALGCVLLAPIAWAKDGVPDLARWSGTAWLNVLYLGSFGTAIAFVTYYLAVRIGGLGRTMPALGLVPLFGVIGAALLLGERLTPLHALGGALVVAGILIPAIGARPSQAQWRAGRAS